VALAVEDLVDTEKYPLSDQAFRLACRETLERDGAAVFRGFFKPGALAILRREAEENEHLAYFCSQNHNVYLTPPDPDYPKDHPRNREVVSSKGCIPDDIVPGSSPLRRLYESQVFRDFLCEVLEERSLHEYADPLSSVNIHYFKPGQELGWHFDNSSFAITLMVQEPQQGGAFKYVAGLRNADKGDMNFEGVGKVLDGDLKARELAMDAGALVLFRGRDAIHCVVPVEGDRTRILAVLAYNSEPGVSLSESARLTFFGRLQ
jgi:hypothetical protein